MAEKQIAVSIVSHGQIQLVMLLLNDLALFCPENIEVILTLNLPEALPEALSAFSFPVHIIHNAIPKGFGENHNKAFRKTSAPYFAVLNPDMRLTDNPFTSLINSLEEKTVGAVTPVIMDNTGHLADNARLFLTPVRLIKRIVKKEKALLTISPDWIAGMFMMFRREVYAEIQGFDERYYLYCEDMDLCARLKLKHYRVLVNTRVKAIHSAQRDSHRKLKYLFWHVKSLLRYFYRVYTVYKAIIF